MEISNNYRVCSNIRIVSKHIIDPQKMTGNHERYIVNSDTRVSRDPTQPLTTCAASTQIGVRRCLDDRCL